MAENFWGGRRTPKNIQKAVGRGIETARRRYERWSGDEDLWWAPESTIVNCVADSISRLSTRQHPLYLTLEQGIGGLHPNRRGKPPRNASRQGRYDITLWWGYKADVETSARVVVEIKNGRSMIAGDVWQKDILRIIGAVSGASSIRMGVFAYYWSDKTRANVENRLTNRKEDIEKLAGPLCSPRIRLSVNCSRIREGLDEMHRVWWAAQTVCVVRDVA